MICATPEQTDAICEIILGRAKWLKEKWVPQWQYPNLRDETMGNIQAGKIFLFQDRDTAVSVATINTKRPTYYPSHPFVRFGEENTWYLSKFATHPKFYHQWYGQKSLQTLFESAKNNGVQDIRIDILRANESLLNFYEKNGFEIDSIWICDYGHTVSKELYFLRKIL